MITINIEYYQPEREGGVRRGWGEDSEKGDLKVQGIKLIVIFAKLFSKDGWP